VVSMLRSADLGNLPEWMAAKMRQSLDEFERAFLEETHVDRVRRESLRRKAVLRSRQRSLEKVHKRGTARFVMLVLMIIATAVIVTIAMFQTLAYVMG
jgi:membrane glycosyltransferase